MLLYPHNVNTSAPDWDFFWEGAKSKKIARQLGNYVILALAFYSLAQNRNYNKNDVSILVFNHFIWSEVYTTLYVYLPGEES